MDWQNASLLADVGFVFKRSCEWYSRNGRGDES
jgi:hypothetical protein